MKGMRITNRLKSMFALLTVSLFNPCLVRPQANMPPSVAPRVNDNPELGWTGTWKLNVSKSSIPGPSFTLALAPDGEYRMENGTFGYTFGCDGQEYKTSPVRTISCKLDDSSDMDTTSRENGRIVRTDHWQLYSDGSKLRHTSSEPQADGSTKSHLSEFVRVSGSVGFAGGWSDLKRLESHPRLVLTMKDSTLHLAFLETGQHADITLDGSDSAMHGPGLLIRTTLAIRPNGAYEFLTTKKTDGRVINQGSLKLSADGHTLVEEYWSPNSPDEKAILVYDKQ